MLTELNPQNAWVFRITHMKNVPWILDHGLHCRNSTLTDSNFVQIGNPSLIQARHYRRMKGPYGGTLSDYVPFYFTPRSPMFYNIKTGYRGIQQRPNEEIVILFTSLRRLQQLSVPFVFTDRHAYLEAAQPPFDNLVRLDKIDWRILQRSDFARDPENPEKVERYEAEALIHKHLPVNALQGIACCDATSAAQLRSQVTKRGLPTQVNIEPRWYFS